MTTRPAPPVTSALLSSWSSREGDALRRILKELETAIGDRFDEYGETSTYASTVPVPLRQMQSLPGTWRTVLPHAGQCESLEDYYAERLYTELYAENNLYRKRTGKEIDARLQRSPKIPSVITKILARHLYADREVHNRSIFLYLTFSN